MEKVQEQLEDYVGLWGFVLSFVLTMFLLFLSFASTVRIISTSVPLNMVYGYPFGMYAQSLSGKIQILWSGLVLNSAIFSSTAFTTVYLTRRFVLSRIPI